MSSSWLTVKKSCVKLWRPSAKSARRLSLDFTLGRKKYLERFTPDEFDYIVIDEFHHAAARTYRLLIDYFAPKFLQGLTATPERTDGGDLLALCKENLIFRSDLVEGIREQLLSPFHYYGVPDEVDYQNIPWKSSHFDEVALTEAVATRARAENALDQYRKRGGTQTLAFCCSTRHADFMRTFFRDADVRAAAVHSESSSDPRVGSLEQLSAGALDIVFAVDIFNEGVDLPSIDTVMMLRPTESRILWLQQFGRGLRKAEGKPRLTVIDYIGNHRTFLLKPQTLFSLPSGDAQIDHQLRLLEQGKAEFPPGCEVTYELETINILRTFLRLGSDDSPIKYFYEDFRDRNGVRPTATELYHEGYSPGSLRKSYGSWFGFVQTMGDLSSKSQQLAKIGSAAEFLKELEITAMTRSYKMLVVLAMLNSNCFPGEISIDRLCDGVRRLARRSAALLRDLAVPLDDSQALETKLVGNPIRYWKQVGGTSGVSYFTYRDRQFATTFHISDQDHGDYANLVRELADWRLATYLDRKLPSDRPKNDKDDGTTELDGLERGRSYTRKDIPPAFGFVFNTGAWNQGYVAQTGHIFLFVALEKIQMAQEFHYADRFLSRDLFERQSQNKQSQESPAGWKIRDHAENDISVHLLVRKTKKTSEGKATPFTYCGDVDFVSWDGDEPITVQWRLKQPLPDQLARHFEVA
ncbi:MAG: hypothetical protein CL484_13385 [Acidobacteria bacterium]|nr:hypothetical protein [Acidobacteriota bacterium]